MHELQQPSKIQNPKSKNCKVAKKKKITDHLRNRPPFHEELKGFDIRVNSFGEMESTFEIDKLNEFLNKEVSDKKLENKEGDDKEKTDEEE